HLRPTSSDVSRQHCAVVLRDERVFLRDYGSPNGTLLNGRTLLGGEVELVDGDEIEVGPLTFRLGLAVASVPTDTSATSSTETDDDLMASSLLESAPRPGDTVHAAKRPKKKPGDANELLCLE